MKLSKIKPVDTKVCYRFSILAYFLKRFFANYNGESLVKIFNCLDIYLYHAWFLQIGFGGGVGEYPLAIFDK